jgi:hypothetical protein
MAAADREIPAEDSIKVVCRFRPLNDSEEKAGSKYVVKFPQGQEENCISIGVSFGVEVVTFHRFSYDKRIFRKKERFVLNESAKPQFVFAAGSFKKFAVFK